MSRTVTRTGHQVRTRVFISSNEGLRCLTRVASFKIQVYSNFQRGLPRIVSFPLLRLLPLFGSARAAAKAKAEEEPEERRLRRSNYKVTALNSADVSHSCLHRFCNQASCLFVFGNAHALTSIYLLRMDCL
ncbi:unnamed protein product [Musa banksii]